MSSTKAEESSNVEAEMKATDKKTDEPISVSAGGDTADDGDADKWKGWMNTKKRLSPKYKLITDANYRRNSMWSLQFAVLCSAISTKMLAPNYAIMCSGYHEDSFPDTEPFGFNSATYFIPMMSLLGVAISSTIIGPLSDRIGRKGPLIWMAIISAIGNIVKYYTRNTFWAFSITNLVFGFFLGNLPVGMAYVGDIFSSKIEKEKQLGMLVGNYVMGNSGGGMIAILMSDSGLFAPLWVGAGLMVVAAVLLTKFLIEPGDVRLVEPEKDALLEEQEADGQNKRPETIDNTAMWNIIGGALFDNFGSTALFPMCLSPLALEQYTLQFINANPPQDPILSVVGYQWLSVCVALLVVPSTMITPHVFSWIGPSGCCVFGNVFTGILTMILLFIAGYAPATHLAFGFFVFVMYGGFPFTVFSQLTTGPMLDIIAPKDKLGLVQGLNNAAMNFGMALAPWLFGILADATTTNISIWVGIGISFMAGIINAPLMCRPEMGPPPKPTPYEKRIMKDEDAELVEEALSGEHVPPALLFSLNRRRAKLSKPYLVPRVKPYSEDKENLDELRKNALDNFRFRNAIQDQALAEITNPESEVNVEELCDILNTAVTGDPDVIREHTRDVGQWIADYLFDNGYHPHINSLLLKQMTMAAFPTINQDGEYTPENLEASLIRSRHIMGKYREHEEKNQYSLFRGVLGKGNRPQFYT